MKREWLFIFSFFLLRNLKVTARLHLQSPRRLVPSYLSLSSLKSRLSTAWLSCQDECRSLVPFYVLDLNRLPVKPRSRTCLSTVPSFASNPSWVLSCARFVWVVPSVGYLRVPVEDSSSEPSFIPSRTPKSSRPPFWTTSWSALLSFH